MSAFRNAGASFTPSPVIATTSPRERSASAMRSLASGEVRANTISPGLVEQLVELRLAHRVEVAADHGGQASCADPDLAGDLGSGQRMITGDDQHADAGGVTSRDRFGDLGAGWVEHRDGAEEAE